MNKTINAIVLRVTLSLSKGKYLPIIIMLLTSAKAMAQAVPKETVVDEVYRSFIDSTFTSYYLMENCAPLKLSKDDLNQVKVPSKNAIPPYSLEEIRAKAAVDTLPLKWTQAALANVIKCLGAEEANTVLGKQFADSSSAKKKEAEDERKSWIAQTQMGKTVYTFSRPIFDKKGQYALINMKWQNGAITQTGWVTNFRSCLCVLKSIKGHWRLIEKVDCVE
jgi:hypothetical protein